MTKVSIIIPTFNRGYILADAIQSVLDQTYPHFELIIVDDGSTDDTAGVIDKFADDRIRLIRHTKNVGVATARNTGLRAAQCELVSFLDSDDLWKPDKLAREVKFLQNNPGTDAVFTDLEKIEGEWSVRSVVRTCPAFARLIGNADLSVGATVHRRAMYLCMLQEMPIKIPATTFRHGALRSAWTFKETWKSGEDWEFLLRFARTHNFGFIDSPLAIQRVMSDSTLGQHKKADALFLSDMFIREKRSVHEDREATIAVRRGIATHSRRLGHCYRDEGRLLDSTRAYLRGFAESGDLGLLARVPAIYLPLGFRQFLKGVVTALWHYARAHAMLWQSARVK